MPNHQKVDSRVEVDHSDVYLASNRNVSSHLLIAPPCLSSDERLLLDLISQHSWPCSDVGKWHRAPGIHLGTKEAIFSLEGPKIIGKLVYDKIVQLDPMVAGVAGDGVGGTAISVAVATSVPECKNPLVPLHVRLRSEVSRNKSLVEGVSSLPPGARVAVVDDTVDSARSISRVINVIRDAGFEVTCAVFLIARHPRSIDALVNLGINSAALFSKDQLNSRLFRICGKEHR